MRWIPILALLTACSGDDGATDAEDPTPICDGKLQADEGDVIDGPFDGDGDGYVDGNVPDCAAVYGVNALDCDDSNPDMHPDQIEIECNGIDDDCNSDTPDAFDNDRDGVPNCGATPDCDDDDPNRYPGEDVEDICWDGIDNNCDDVVDEGCGLDYNGFFALDQRIQYGCAVGTINIDFDEVSVLYNPPYASLFSQGSGVQPGNMNGEIDEDGTFDFFVANILSTAASCEERYYFQGTFSDADTFVGDFYAEFIGGFTCLNCESQLWTNITGTRTDSPYTYP